jgi:hypothetical protein
MIDAQKPWLKSAVQSHLDSHYSIMNALILGLIMFYHLHSQLICLKNFRQFPVM